MIYEARGWSELSKVIQRMRFEAWNVVRCEMLRLTKADENCVIDPRELNSHFSRFSRDHTKAIPPIIVKSNWCLSLRKRYILMVTKRVVWFLYPRVFVSAVFSSFRSSRHRRIVRIKQSIYMCFRLSYFHFIHRAAHCARYTDLHTSIWCHLFQFFFSSPSSCSVPSLYYFVRQSTSNWSKPIKCFFRWRAKERRARNKRTRARNHTDQKMME